MPVSCGPPIHLCPLVANESQPRAASVDRDHAGGLRPIDVEPQVVVARELRDGRDGQDDAGGRRDVRNLDDPGARRDQRLDPVDVGQRVHGVGFERLDDDAVRALPVEPGKRAAGMRVGLEDHLVRGLQFQATRDDAGALGGVAHEAGFIRLAAEIRGDNVAGLGEKSVPRFDPFLQLPARHREHVQHPARRRAEPTGVEVGALGRHRELRPHLPPKSLGVVLGPRGRHRRLVAVRVGRAEPARGQEPEGAGAETAQKGLSVEIHGEEKVRVWSRSRPACAASARFWSNCTGNAASG